MPCVRPFQAPCTPPVPPSMELSGKPTRMLMFWLGFSPYRMFTWQYARFAPTAATRWASADLTPLVPSKSLPGAVSAAQPTGAGGGGGPFGPLPGPGAEIAGAANARPSRLAIATFVDAERMNDFLRIVTMMAPNVSQGRRS